MRHLLILSCLFLVMLSCSSGPKEVSSEQIIQEYLSGLNDSGFGSVSEYVSDSVRVSEFAFPVARSKKDLQRIFQWDSVFAPRYELIDTEEIEGKLVGTISKECQRIRFLNDTAIVYRVVFEFSGNRISHMQTIEYLAFDMKKWTSRRDSLVSWIETRHPELKGFHQNQTEKGARDYLRAIELYTERAK